MITYINCKNFPVMDDFSNLMKNSRYLKNLVFAATDHGLFFILLLAKFNINL